LKTPKNINKDIPNLQTTKSTNKQIHKSTNKQKKPSQSGMAHL